MADFTSFEQLAAAAEAAAGTLAQPGAQIQLVDPADDSIVFQTTV